MNKYVVMFALMVCCATELPGKRLPPKPVPPVTKDGVSYSASGGGFEEFVVATEEASGRELWRVRVYEVVPPPAVSSDIFATFITQLKLSGGTLYVKNEAGRCYQVELEKKKASGVRCPVMAAALQTSAADSGRAEFHWDWRASEELKAAESLRNARITQADRKSIARAIVAQLRGKMGDLEVESEEGLRKAALDTRIKMIDLNGDGVPEVLAQGMVDCSPTGNCPLWVFQKGEKDYHLLLKRFGQTFTIQHESTNGYRDVVVCSHGSATQYGISEFRYKGGRYRLVGQYDAEWSVLENGKEKLLKEPRITPYP
jgi:hypothetical protein